MKLKTFSIFSVLTLPFAVVSCSNILSLNEFHEKEFYDSFVSEYEFTRPVSNNFYKKTFSKSLENYHGDTGLTSYKKISYAEDEYYMANLFNQIKLFTNQVDTKFNEVYDKVLRYDNFLWSNYLNENEFKNFAKTYLGTFLIFSFFAKETIYDRHQKLLNDYGKKYDNSRPNFLNNEILNHLEKKESQKNLLSFVYEEINNWYPIVKKEKVRFLVNGENTQDFYLFKIKISNSYLHSKSYYDKENSNEGKKTQTQSYLDLKKKKIESRGDKLIAAVPINFLSESNNLLFPSLFKKETFFDWKLSTPIEKCIACPDIYIGREILFRYLMYPHLELILRFFSFDHYEDHERKREYLELFKKDKEKISKIKNTLKTEWKNLYTNNYTEEFDDYNWYVELDKKNQFLFITASKDNLVEFITKKNGAELLNFYNKYNHIYSIDSEAISGIGRYETLEKIQKLIENGYL